MSGRSPVIETFVVSSVPPRRFWDGTLKLTYDRFLPFPFKFIIQSFHSTLYSVSY